MIFLITITLMVCIIVPAVCVGLLLGQRNRKFQDEEMERILRGE